MSLEEKFISMVTVTGADDSVKVEDLATIQSKYPFVEFGILLSSSQQGSYRFPSYKWLQELTDFNNRRRSRSSLGAIKNLSGHLCGEYVRNILVGEDVFAELNDKIDSPFFTSIFKRWQINTHGFEHAFLMRPACNEYHLSKFHDKCFSNILDYCAARGQTVILQYDKANMDLLNAVDYYDNHHIQALVDLSHGAGILPSEWESPKLKIVTGYAGGLSPENLYEQLSKIYDILNKVDIGNKQIPAIIWIDAETKLRSKNDSVFDLNKVEKFLEITKPFVI